MWRTLPRRKQVQLHFRRINLNRAYGIASCNDTLAGGEAEVPGQA